MMIQDIEHSVARLPDIRESICEVMKYFEDVLDDKYGDDAEKFLDAWLQTQKNQGLRLLYRRRQSELSNLPLKDSE